MIRGCCDDSLVLGNGDGSEFATIRPLSWHEMEQRLLFNSRIGFRVARRTVSQRLLQRRHTSLFLKYVLHVGHSCARRIMLTLNHLGMASWRSVATASLTEFRQFVHDTMRIDRALTKSLEPGQTAVLLTNGTPKQTTRLLCSAERITVRVHCQTLCPPFQLRAYICANQCSYPVNI